MTRDHDRDFPFGTSRRLLPALVILIGLAAPAGAGTVTIGVTNGGSRDPLFDTGTRRLQQIYAADQFGAGPVWITRVAFQSQSQTSYDTALADIRIEMSTSRHSPAAMSDTLADNIGADRVTVLDRGPAAISPTDVAGDFDVVLNFTTPFYYNPASGGLLIDLFVYSGAPEWQFATTVDRSRGDTNARMTDGIGEFSTGGSVLYTQFTFAPAGTTVPEPSAIALLGLGILGAGAVASRRRTR